MQISYHFPLKSLWALFSALAVIAAGLVLPASVSANGSPGNVTGIIQDSAGSPLPNAQIRIEAIDSNGFISSFIGNSTATSEGGVDLDLNFTAHSRIQLTFSSTGDRPGAPTSFVLTEPAADQVWRLNSVNFSGTLTKTDGTTPLAFAYLRIEQVDSMGNTLGTIFSGTADSLGRFQLYVPFGDDRLYQLSFQPGFSNDATTDPTGTETRVPLSNGSLDGTYRLALVTLGGTVLDSNGSRLPSAGVQIEAVNESNQVLRWLGGSAADSNGDFRLAIDFTANPRVKLTVGPPWGGTALGASKFYYIDSPGSLSGSYQLATVNVSGKVCDAGVTCNSDGGGLPNASYRVEQVDSSGNWLAFVQGGQADSSGLVKLSLDFTGGKQYRLTAGPPYGGSAAGADTSFIITEPISDQYWSLTAPNVTGIIRDVNGAPLANAFVSVMSLDANGFMQNFISGASTDSGGRFNLAIPDSNLAAGANGVNLQVSLPSGYSGQGTLTTRQFIPTSDASVSMRDLDITLNGANAVVRVVDSSGIGIQNAWVNVRETSRGSSVSGQTNASGLAFLSLPEVTDQAQLLAAEYQINVQAPNDRRGDFADATITGSFQMVGEFPLPLSFVTLSSPTLRIKATYDGEPSGSPMSWTGVEIRGISNPGAYTWSHTDAQGNASLSLADGDYELVIRAPWNSGGTVVANKTFQVSLVDGVASVSDDGSPLTAISGRFILGPNIPTMVILTKAGGTALGGGWIEVVETESRRWIQGASIRSDGKAGILLDPGTYRLTASPPWGSGNYSSAEPCQVVVNNARAITSTTCGTPVGGEYILDFRSPNLSFTVKQPTGSTPVPFANVCVVQGSGANANWSCSSSNRSGVVSLFVDPPDGGAATEIEYQLIPPWGTSDYPRTAGTATWNSGTQVWVPSTERFASPNVRITVTAAGAPVRDGWVNVLKLEPDPDNPGSNRWQYLSGAPTGRDGVASISLSSSELSSSLCVDIYPGQALSTQYGGYRNCVNPLAGSGAGTEADPRVVSFALNSANTRIIVLSTDGTPNKWGGVRVERNGEDYIFTLVNDEGRLAAYLPDGNYTLWFYPGPSGRGAPVSLSVTVSGGVANLPGSISLSSGNLTGTVTRGGVATGSAFVSAVNSSTGDELGSAVAPDGTFTLSLGNGTWRIRAYDPSTGGSSSVANVTVSFGVATPQSLSLSVG